ncbi:MAG TPA: hypothetical protein DHV14_14575 [Micrococcales bacterium]|nr:hypothetical protein [Micrococcales bacterium]
MTPTTRPDQEPSELGESTMTSVVATLTRDELQAIHDNVAAGRLDQQLKSLDERGIGQKLVRDQYSGRYPFELLQNAADAAAEAAEARGERTEPQGRVRFELTHQALLVADNGAGFGPEQIKSICSLGRSTKSPTKSVGYKGLGFKSVGEITDSPQIITAGVRFGFDDARVARMVEDALGRALPDGQHLPTYAFPFELDDADLGTDAVVVATLLADGYTSVLRLPLREDVARDTVEEQLLDNVHAQLLLFLGSLRELVLAGTSADFKAFVVRVPQGDADQVLLEVDDITSEWLVYTRHLPVGNDLVSPMGEAWKKVETVTAAAAFPVGSDNRPLTVGTHPLHVYFPTDELTALPFVVHADWALHLDRRQLSTTPQSAAYNAFLTDAAADLVAAAATDLAARFGDPTIPSAVLAPRGTPTGAGAAFQRRLLEVLPELAFVATVSGELVTPREVQLLDYRCPDVHAFHELADVTGAPHLAAPDVEADSAVRKLVFDLRQMVAPLGLRASLELLALPEDDTTAYYQHLLEWDRKVGRTEFARVLATLACVRTQDGQVVTPRSRVFFARARGEDIPIELPLPIAVLPDDIEGLAGLLEDAGVGRFEWRDIITDYVAPLLSDPGTDDDTRRRALDALRAYLRMRRSSTGDREVRDAVAGVLVPARDADGWRHEMVPVSDVYFTADWTGQARLEAIYGPFGQVEFLDVPPPADPEAQDLDRELWEFCGVAASPRVMTAEAANQRDYITYEMGWKSHPDKGAALWSAWWANDAVEHAKMCRSNHPQSQQLRTSHTLDRFDELVEAGDPRRLQMLWAALAADWTDVYEPVSTARFRCVHGNHLGDERRAPSLLRYSLEHRAWLPVGRGSSARLVTPAEAWRVNRSTPAHIKARVPALPDAMTLGLVNRGLMLALGVVDASNLEPEDLYGLLRALADEAGDEPVTDEQVKAARWAMRALNDALQPGRHVAPDVPVPLLAKTAGQYVFASDPVVVHDPLLQEAWGERRPVLDADEDCQALVKLLGLTVLKPPLVRVIPHEIGHRADLVDQVQAHLDRAAAFMLALLRKVRPSAEEAFVARVKRVDVRPCNELILQYTFGEESVELPSAVSHIAARRELVHAAGGPPTRPIFGTAYLEISPTGALPWFVFGPQLAAHVDTDNYGDQFGQILSYDDATRYEFLMSKQITPDDVGAAAATLGRADALLDDLIDPGITDDEDLDDETGSDQAGPDDGDGPDAPDSAPQEPDAGGQDDGDEHVAAPGGAGAAPTGTGGGAGRGPVTSGAPADRGTPTGGPSGTSGTTPPAPPTPPSAPALPPLPDIDMEHVEIVDAHPGHVVTAPGATTTPTGTGPGGGGYGGAWTPEPPVSETRKRENGRRGEQVVYLAECQRVKALGMDPDEVVVWRSDAEQFAPYDIASVDDHGVSIFIEVKSTEGVDPHAPFDISPGELNEAIRFGEKFRIFRVTAVRTAAPVITRYTDPVALVRSGTATLDVAKARMRFGRDDDPDPATGSRSSASS